MAAKSTQELQHQIEDISDTYKNMESFAINKNTQDIVIKFYDRSLTVLQIREIEAMNYTITNIDFINNMVKFSKRWDRS